MTDVNNTIEIVRGFRTCGLDDVYASDPAVEIEVGVVITKDGALATLDPAKHIEVGIAIQANQFGAAGHIEASGKIPVMVSNFIVRTSYFEPAVYNVGDIITVVDGKPKLGAAADAVWGYVSAVEAEAGTIDIRVNY